MVIISSQLFFIPFLMASFLPMGAGCVPVWVGRVVGSMETLSREISCHPCFCTMGGRRFLHSAPLWSK